MPDYNIYIHSFAEGGSDNSPTKPWENQQNSGDLDVFKTAQQVINDAEQIATSGFGSFVNAGVAFLSKAVPAVAIAMVALKITDSILSTGFTHVETYTGHYEYSMGYNNFKTGFRNFLNPVGTVINYVHRQAQFNRENKRIEQERMLVGNSIYNITTKGV